MTTPDQIDLARASAFRIGPITVEPALRQVTAARSETLEPRVMQVLVVLAMANGGIVSRDDLVRQCWEGRIVGDDSITRVIARLRKLAEDHGDGAFRIETITKVGYRLVGPVVLAAAMVPKPLGQEAVVTSLAEMRATRTRRWSAAGLAAVMLVALGVAAWWAMRPVPLQVSLRVGEFTSLSPEVPTTLPAALQSELLLKFGEAPNPLVTIVRTAPGDNAQAYVMTGTIRKVGDTLHFVVNLSREGSGETPISLGFDRPVAASAASVASVAAEAVPIMTCTLQGTVEGRTRPLPEPTVLLFARFCRLTSSDQDSRSAAIALVRQATTESPDFAVGWVALAAVLASAMPEADKHVGKPDYYEALAALAKAQNLGLANFMVLNTRARLLPSREFAKREAILSESARTFATESNGAAPFNYCNMLWNAGRIADATVQNRLALQINSNHEEGVLFQAQMLRSIGERRESDAMIRTLDANWPEREHGRRFKLTDAIRDQDYTTARAALVGVTALNPLTKSVIDDALVALQRGDARARATAADRIVALNASRETRERLSVDLLAALGRDSDALKAAQLFVYGPVVPSTKALFNPALARARALPAFAELAGRLGLIDYWRSTGHLPDFCSAAEAPPLCEALKRRN